MFDPSHLYTTFYHGISMGAVVALSAVVTPVTDRSRLHFLAMAKRDIKDILLDLYSVFNLAILLIGMRMQA